MQVIYTDGGRAKTEYEGREDFDCTVMALAHAASMSYEHAHEILRISGRLEGCTHMMEDGLKTYEAEGLGSSIPFEGTWNLVDVVREHPEGRFIVRKRGHVFAIVDGIVYEDQRHEKADAILRYDRIIKMWRLIPEEPCAIGY